LWISEETNTICIYRSYEKHQQKLLEIRSSKKKKQGIVIENEVIDEVQNIRLKSNEFREIGKLADICSPFYFYIEKNHAIAKQNQ